jgi:predicted CXXCH cytochrome family protein
MKRRTVFVVLAALVAISLASAGSADAQEMDCAMCHPDKAEGAAVHPAVLMGCTACHTGVDAAEIPHTFSGEAPRGLMAEPPALCFACHDQSKFSGANTVHMPVQAGMCTGCHNPHVSSFPKMLLAENICFNCHDKTQYDSKANVHPPVMGGMCTSCHQPHQSDQSKLLNLPAPNLCYTCHDSKGFYGPTVHPPVSIGTCNACHEMHQSDHPKLLLALPGELCFFCHDQSVFQGTSTHKPVAEGECTKCHKPHASQNESLLHRRGNILCRKCHAKVERSPHAVAGFTSLGHPVRGRRDPMRKGKTFGCASCHVPHASDSPTLFRYKARDVFDLCTHCHQF